MFICSLCLHCLSSRFTIVHNQTHQQKCLKNAQNVLSYTTFQIHGYTEMPCTFNVLFKKCVCKLSLVSQNLLFLYVTMHLLNEMWSWCTSRAILQVICGLVCQIRVKHAHHFPFPSLLGLMRVYLSLWNVLMLLPAETDDSSNTDPSERFR